MLKTFGFIVHHFIIRRFKSNSDRQVRLTGWGACPKLVNGGHEARRGEVAQLVERSPEKA
jgi:hypothetical protein